MTIETTSSTNNNNISETNSFINNENRTDPILNNLWSQLDQIQPTIPDRISVAFMESNGIQMDNCDPRLARLVSLAGQKFITDILTDAMLHWRLSNGLNTGLLSTCTTTNNNSTTTGSNSSSSNTPTPTTPTATTAAAATTTTTSASGSNKVGTNQPGRQNAERKPTLTLDDLIASLNDRGIQVARPVYYR